jgi:hypothetical protein
MQTTHPPSSVQHLGVVLHLLWLQSSEWTAFYNGTWMHGWFLYVKAVTGWYSYLGEIWLWCCWEMWSSSGGQHTNQWKARLWFFVPILYLVVWGILQLCCHLRIHITFIFCRQSSDILEATQTFIFSSYKRWQFITTISIACVKNSYPFFRFYTIITRISSKSEDFDRL